jgi:hypothetical protein
LNQLSAKHHWSETAHETEESKEMKVEDYHYHHPKKKTHFVVLKGHHSKTIYTVRHGPDL